MLLPILIGFFSTAAFAQTQSDYEIQENFKEQYATYQQQIEEVSSPDSAEKLIAAIKVFDQKYSEHEELLDKALYPDTYKERIENLKKSSIRTLERVETITKQHKKLKKLETQMASYKEDLNRLDKQADSLKTAIKKSTQSEQKLSTMLRDYRKSLEKRDELILKFINSMAVTYRQMDLEALKNVENDEEQSHIKSNSALKFIYDISEENIRILERDAGKLEVNDYMRMAEVNHQFSQMWKRIGEKIKEVYDGENADMLAQNISNNLEQWNHLLTTNTLNAISDTFDSKNINIHSFSTSDEFYTALTTYLNDKIKQSEKNRSQEEFNHLQTFKEFWDRVEIEWGNSLVKANILDKKQIATINQKVDQWTQVAEPRSNNILVYFLGASVLLAVALGVMLIRERQSIRNRSG